MENRDKPNNQYKKEAFIRIVGNQAEFQVEMACENFEHINRELRGYYLTLLNDFHKSPEFNTKLLKRASELFEDYYSRLKNRRQEMEKKCNPVKNTVPDSDPAQKAESSEKFVPELIQKADTILKVVPDPDTTKYSDSDEMPNYSQEDWQQFEKDSLKRSSTFSSNSTIETENDFTNEPLEKIKKTK